MRGRERGISKIEAKHGKTDLVQSFAARVHPSVNPRGPVRELRGNNAATQSSFCEDQ